MPFGRKSTRDELEEDFDCKLTDLVINAFRQEVHEGLKTLVPGEILEAKSSMPFGRKSTRDIIMMPANVGILEKSSMPFGRKSTRDPPEGSVTSMDYKSVINAFRQEVHEGLVIHNFYIVTC